MKRRPPLNFTMEIREKLNQISRSRTEPAGRVNRATVLLMYESGKKVTEIAHEMKSNRPAVERTLDRAISFGPLQALKDLPRPGRPARIPDDAKMWVLSLACQKPNDLGYASETWTYSALIRHVRAHCEKEGYPGLLKLGKGRLNAILSKGNIKPHKIRYYQERRDPDFEMKMADVLYVYKEVELLNKQTSSSERNCTTISYDEKPGIQAIKNIVADLLPIPNKHPAITRDNEYKRLGTVSLLAGIDLHTGDIIPLVKDRHRSREFIEFLSKLDATYPQHWKIRLILDNHSAHISKETQKYLKDKPSRFDFVFTPKHGSWLNLIEVFFSKLSRSVLRHIRVSSKQELVERIYQGIAEFNQEPVVFRWHYKMDEAAVA
jgi:transposase